VFANANHVIYGTNLKQGDNIIVAQTGPDFDLFFHRLQRVAEATDSFSSQPRLAHNLDSQTGAGVTVGC
jgi:hypothetical protein